MKLSDEQRKKIGELVGEATACWETLEGAGVFDSKRASEILNKIYETIEE